jgi:hypothetical protein
MQYKLVKNKPDQVMFIDGSVHGIIPFDLKNTDYQKYLKWIDGCELQMTGPAKYEWIKTSDGNTPLPADE